MIIRHIARSKGQHEALDQFVYHGMIMRFLFLSVAFHYMEEHTPLWIQP